MKPAKITCGAIVRDSQGQVLVLRRSASDVRRPLQWDLPGGHAGANETPEQAVIRELREETSLKTTEQPQHVFTTSATFKGGTHVDWLFFVVPVEPGSIILSNEHDKYQWLPLDEAIEQVTYGPKQLALKHVRDHGLL